MTWVLATAVLVAGAIELRWPSWRRLVATRSRRPVRRLRVDHRIATVVAAGCGLVVVPVLLSGPALLVGIALAGIAAALLRVVARSRGRAAAARRRRGVVDTMSFLVSELRAGAVPETALASVALDEPGLASAARAARQGVDVAPVLRAAAQHPGAEAWSELAATWTAAERSGAPVADVVARLVDRVRDDLELDREVEAELAPARATGRIMAVLPALGLALGAGAGADPLDVVVTTWPGAISATIGSGLAVAGLLWIERIAGSVPR